MEDKEKKFINPYERLKEITKKLEELSERESIIKNMTQREQKILQRELDENESRQLFLFIEKDVCESCINWIEVYKKGWDDSKRTKNEQGGEHGK